jgi:hypothetical protein
MIVALEWRARDPIAHTHRDDGKRFVLHADEIVDGVYRI